MLRHEYIGGSDIGAIIQAEGAFNSPFDVWERKRGLAKEEPATLIMNLGTACEGPILDEYELQQGVALTRSHFMVDDKYKYMAGEADGVFEEQTDDTYVKRIGVDAKFTSKYPFDDVLPQSWQAQAQWYMMLCGAAAWDFAVVHSSFPGQLHIYRLERDDNAIEYLRREAVAFWGLVQNNTPPQPQTLNECARYFKAMGAVQKEKAVADDCVADIHKRIVLNMGIEKEAKAIADKLKAEFVFLTEGADVVVNADGNKLATYSTNKNGVRSLRVVA